MPKPSPFSLSAPDIVIEDRRCSVVVKTSSGSKLPIATWRFKTLEALTPHVKSWLRIYQLPNSWKTRLLRQLKHLTYEVAKQAPSAEMDATSFDAMQAAIKHMALMVSEGKMEERLALEETKTLLKTTHESLTGFTVRHVDAVYVDDAERSGIQFRVDVDVPDGTPVLHCDMGAHGVIVLVRCPNGLYVQSGVLARPRSPLPEFSVN